ncbi:hypothetical protein [Paenibacillus koleovorans]|uniref:hypothetical protein n=1 Tax=Paenibacillus koleovorans TaxID=121608 RepID=UPI000FDB42C7|nr:hypothetical protein [Paenibacillus koleovorans]
MKVCKVPGCCEWATRTWATVPLCQAHRDAIEREHVKYYWGHITADNRVTYKLIWRYTPWYRLEERRRSRDLGR